MQAVEPITPELQAAIAELAGVTHLTTQDWADFLSCSDSEREMLVQVYKDAGWMPEPSAWVVALDIIKGCAEIASLVLPITGAVQAVYGIANLEK
jgi:hypothetical protein